MIPRRWRNYSSLCLLLVERKDRVCRATNLEGACFLKIFAFEIEIRSCNFIERSAREDGRAVDARRDPAMSGADRMQVRFNLKRLIRHEPCPDAFWHNFPRLRFQWPGNIARNTLKILTT